MAETLTLAHVEEALTLKLGALDARMARLEEQNNEFFRQLTKDDMERKQIISIITKNFSEVHTILQQTSSGFFSRGSSRGLSPSVTAKQQSALLDGGGYGHQHPDQLPALLVKLEQRVSALEPKITSVHDKLVSVLEGEDRASAFVEEFIPSVNRLSADFESFRKLHKSDMDTLRQEYLQKLLEIARACLRKADEASDSARNTCCDTKSILEHLDKQSHLPGLSEAHEAIVSHKENNSAASVAVRNRSSRHVEEKSLKQNGRENRRRPSSSSSSSSRSFYSSTESERSSRHSSNRSRHDRSPSSSPTPKRYSRRRSHSKRSRRSRGSLDHDVNKIMLAKVGKIAVAVDEVSGNVDAILRQAKKDRQKSCDDWDTLSGDLKILKEKASIGAQELHDSIRHLTSKGDLGGAIQTIEKKLREECAEIRDLVQNIGSEHKNKMTEVTTQLASLNHRDDTVSLKKHLDSCATLRLEMVPLQNNIDRMVKDIIVNQVDEKSRGQEIIDSLKNTSSRLEELHITLIPELEEIKKQYGLLLEKDELVQQEDHNHIQKILNIVEDIRGSTCHGGFQPARPKSQATLLQTDTNLIQVFNAMTDLKKFFSSRDDERKQKCAEMKMKMDEVVTNQRTIFKRVDDVSKNATADAKTLSQMNMMLQGLKTTISGIAGKDCGKEDVSKLENINTTVLAIRDDQLAHVKEVTLLLKDRKSLKAEESRITSALERKLLELWGKEHGVLLNELKSLLKGGSIVYREKSSEVTDSESGGGTLETRGSSAPTSTPFGNFAGELNALLDKSLTKCQVNYVKILDEMVKHNGISSEILNSVEDMKQLVSSTPTILCDLPPKIEKLEKCLADIPNEYGAVNAAMEENLCVNLEKKMKDINQRAMQEIFSKFELMDHRLAVIKKYAKHGPSSLSVDSVGTGSSESATNASIDSYNASEVRSEIQIILDRLAPICSQDFQRAVEEKLEAHTIPLLHEIRATGKQLLEETAKSVVLEEQFEALADTVLKPVGEISQRQEDFLNLFQTDVKELLEQSMSGLVGTSDPSTTDTPQHRTFILPSHLKKLEAKLSTGQRDCLRLLKEMKEENDLSNAMLFSEPSRHSVTNVRTLVRYLKGVQRSQHDILLQGDTRIEQQTAFNEVLNKIVSILESIELVIASRQGDKFGQLPELCTVLHRKIDSLTQLDQTFAKPTTKQCIELQNLVQMLQSAMASILGSNPSERRKTSSRTSWPNRSDISKELGEKRHPRSGRKRFGGEDDDGIKPKKERTRNNPKCSAGSSGHVSVPDRHSRETVEAAALTTSSSLTAVGENRKEGGAHHTPQLSSTHPISKEHRESLKMSETSSHHFDLRVRIGREDKASAEAVLDATQVSTTSSRQAEARSSKNIVHSPPIPILAATVASTSTAGRDKSEEAKLPET